MVDLVEVMKPDYNGDLLESEQRSESMIGNIGVQSYTVDLLSLQHIGVYD